MLTLSAIPSTKLFKGEECFIGKFQAMGSPCEVHVDTGDDALAAHVLEIAFNEARRIENKWSRYVSNNIIHAINNSHGYAVRVDAETALVLNFADRCAQLSGGLFDITSGLLRKVWVFNGQNKIPTQAEIAALLPLIGWEKVVWDGTFIRLRKGMEIDLGGIGKEYAVDKALGLVRKATTVSVLINFGGDMAVSRPRQGERAWKVGIENVNQERQAAQIINLQQGALATSGDSKRYVMHNGKRYGHILNPRTGWPVEDAPRSVTVAAATCTEAGFLSTVGMLNGKKADAVLAAAGVPHWCY